MFIFWIVIVVGFIYLLNNDELNNSFNRKKSNSYGNNKQKGPIDIIKERYAKGEINKKEYHDMMNNIK